jgi:hypothetical protein
MYGIVENKASASPSGHISLRLFTARSMSAILAIDLGDGLRSGSDGDGEFDAVELAGVARYV